MHFFIVLITKFITYGIEIVPFKRKIDRKTRKTSALENFGMYLRKYQRNFIYIYKDSSNDSFNHFFCFTLLLPTNLPKLGGIAPPPPLYARCAPACACVYKYLYVFKLINHGIDI